MAIDLKSIRDELLPGLIATRRAIEDNQFKAAMGGSKNSIPFDAATQPELTPSALNLLGKFERQSEEKRRWQGVAAELVNADDKKMSVPTVKGRDLDV